MFDSILPSGGVSWQLPQMEITCHGFLVPMLEAPNS